MQQEEENRYGGIQRQYDEIMAQYSARQALPVAHQLEQSAILSNRALEAEARGLRAEVEYLRPRDKGRAEACFACLLVGFVVGGLITAACIAFIQ